MIVTGVKTPAFITTYTIFPFSNLFIKHLNHITQSILKSYTKHQYSQITQIQEHPSPLNLLWSIKLHPISNKITFLIVSDIKTLTLTTILFLTLIFTIFSYSTILTTNQPIIYTHYSAGTLNVPIQEHRSPSDPI